MKAMRQYTSFINTTAEVVQEYETSDIVCVTADFNFLGFAYGPSYLYTDPAFLDGKTILFISSAYTTDINVREGGLQYETLVHLCGHIFGLAHPFSDGSDSTIMPGIATGYSLNYRAIAGNIQNTCFNTIMTFTDALFFLPEEIDYDTNNTGYPETIMTLDACALRWLYKVKGVSKEYSSKYGARLINPAEGTQRTQMIAGTNQEVTFGSNCNDVSFYFSNQCLSFNNLQPIKYEYNRILEKQWTFYPKDLCSTVSTLNFSNTGTDTGISNIFMEKNALKTNLTVNCIKNKVLNIYIIDSNKNYKITGTTYINKNTGKKMTINNTSNAKINIFFNK